MYQEKSKISQTDTLKSMSHGINPPINKKTFHQANTGSLKPDYLQLMNPNNTGFESKDDETVQMQNTGKKEEVIFVVGGERALKRAWFNFVNAVTLRLSSFEREKNDKVTVIVFAKPYYERQKAIAKLKKDGETVPERSANDPKNYLLEIKKRIKEKEDDDKKINIEFVWNEAQFFRYMNQGEAKIDEEKRSKIKIKRWEYFGHGLEGELSYSYDYDSSTVDPNISINDINKFKDEIFTKHHRFVSWACNTATDKTAGDSLGSWLEEYQKKHGGSAIGAVGTTDYAEVYLTPLRDFFDGDPRLPFLEGSSEKWVAYGEGTGFKSTIDLGWSLNSRRFRVNAGGALRVRLSNLDFYRPPARVKNKNDKITVYLQKNWALSSEKTWEISLMEDNEIVWNGLEGGTYYLVINKSSAQLYSGEALSGDIEVDSF